MRTRVKDKSSCKTVFKLFKICILYEIRRAHLLLTCHWIWPWHNQRSAVICDWPIRRWCHTGHHLRRGSCSHVSITGRRRLLLSDERMNATTTQTSTSIFSPLQTRTTALLVLTGAGDCRWERETQTSLKWQSEWMMWSSVHSAVFDLSLLHPHYSELEKSTDVLL